jgi:hypothetical protein
MNKLDVEIGATYTAKAGSKQTEVRIESAFPGGGWNATNLGNGRPVRIKDARDLKPVKRKVAEASVATTYDTATETRAAASKPPTPAATAAGKGALEAPAVADLATTDAIAVTTESNPSATVGATPRKEKKQARKNTSDTQPDKAMSCLDAAAEVLKAEARPRTCGTLIDFMRERNLWTTNAPTPTATLYSALLREITKKGAAARFRKADRGLFELAKE